MLAEIDRRRTRYLGNRAAVEVTGRAAIVIDDGIATGPTMRAALRATRMRHPKKLVLAVPVAATDTLEELAAEVDDLVCLESYEWFRTIGLYYDDFRQITDLQVIATLPAWTSTRPMGPYCLWGYGGGPHCLAVPANIRIPPMIIDILEAHASLLLAPVRRRTLGDRSHQFHALW